MRCGLPLLLGSGVCRYRRIWTSLGESHQLLKVTSRDVKAIRAHRMQKDQLRAAHTILPSHSGRQASSRCPCCHKESVVASRLPNLAARESTDWHRRQLSVSEFSLSAPPIEALLN